MKKIGKRLLFLLFVTTAVVFVTDATAGKYFFCRQSKVLSETEIIQHEVTVEPGYGGIMLLR